MPKTFYDFRKIDSLGAVFKMVVGARGIGKTYGAVKKAVKRSLTKGEEFIYVRRTFEDIKATRLTFFDAVGVEFPDWDFRIQGKIIDASPVSAREDKKRHWTRIGHLVALSQAAGVKSVSFARVRTIIYDEFIGDDNTLYLSNEADAFVNFYNTVDRYRDVVTVYMLSNAVSIANPYFIKYKIRVPKTGEIVRYADGFIAVHFPKSVDFVAEVSQTRFGRFLLATDPEYSDYAINNKFADNTSELITKKDPTARYRFTLHTKSGVIELWFSSQTKLWYGCEPERVPEHRINFTTEAKMIAAGMPMLDRSDPLLGMLRTAWRKGRVWFTGPEVKNAYLETFK